MSVLGKHGKRPKPSKKAKGYMRKLPGILVRAEKAKRKGSFGDAAILYQKISSMAREAGEWNDAVKYAALSAECSEREGRPFKAGWGYRTAALAARSGGDNEKAALYAALAAQRFEESGSIYAAKWCYSTAAEVSKAAGKPDDAIRFYERARKIEDDDDTANEITRIKKSASHPIVDQYAEKDEIFEGEEAKFEIVIENHSKETLKKITVGDRDARVTHEIGELPPGEISIFSHAMKGKTGLLRSPYNFITWESPKGNVLDFELEPVCVRVRPKLAFTPQVEPDAVVGLPCKLVLLVKNLSSVPLYDVAVDLRFAESVKVPHPESKIFEKIAPGEEYGASWGILLSVPGRHRIAEGKVSMRDADGMMFKEGTGEIMVTVHPRETHAKPPDGGSRGGVSGTRSLVSAAAETGQDALKRRYEDVRELMSSAEKQYLHRKLDDDSFRKLMQEYGKEKAELELKLKRGG